MTGVGRAGRLASPRRDALSAGAPVQRSQATQRRRTLDGEWDEQMTHLLREAAEVREEHERARLSEDALLARRETAALLGAIRAYRRPKVKHLVSRRPSGTPLPRHAAPSPAGCVAQG